IFKSFNFGKHLKTDFGKIISNFAQSNIFSFSRFGKVKLFFEVSLSQPPSMERRLDPSSSMICFNSMHSLMVTFFNSGKHLTTDFGKITSNLSHFHIFNLVRCWRVSELLGPTQIWF
ncbi:hypothetical protein V8G54_001228, partial [Vigna mungo]